MLRAVPILLVGVAVCVLLLAFVVWLVQVGFRAIPSLPTDPTLRAAWIGVIGSLAGTLLTGAIAAIALWPAYRSLLEMQRSSAVQSGEILRTRWKAANAEIDILLKASGIISKIPNKLELSSNDVDLEHWKVYHKDTELKEFTEVIIPSLEAVSIDSFNATAGVDLPDLDRSDLDNFLTTLKTDLYSMLDGIKRHPNGGAHLGTMSPQEWRAHVEKIRRNIASNWPNAHLKYNNKINGAIQILRWQITRADRDAVGASNYKEFDRIQRMMDNPPT